MVDLVFIINVWLVVLHIQENKTKLRSWLDMKNLKLWISSFPHGKAVIVEIIEEYKDKPGYFYIRKPSGRTDTTTSNFLFDLPDQIAAIDMKES